MRTIMTKALATPMRSSFREASRGNVPKSYVPCQTQTEGVHHDEELHDHRKPSQKQEVRGDSTGKAATSFLEEKAVMSIYSGLVPHESRRKLKLTGRVIHSVSATVPEYLHWSESLITFNRTDNSDIIPKPGRFPLIIDPLVGTTRLTKALMDGGSSVNLMYLETFEGLGLTQDHLQSSSHPFYRVVLGKQYVPLGRVTLPITFRDTNNYRTEMLAFEVINFFSPY
jgi:hypothetical protein